MRADLPQQLESLAAWLEAAGIVLKPEIDTLTEAATALRALRDAPVGHVIDLAEHIKAAEQSGANVRLVVVENGDG